MMPHFNQNETSSCFPNYTSGVNPFMNETTIARLNHVYKIWHGLVPLPIALLGLIFTLIYIKAVYKSIQQRRVSRKCYALLMNRAVGDAFACLIAIIIATYALAAPKINRETMQIMDVFFVCCFWSAMVTYVSLSLIKLYAIWEPLKYRNRITMRRCVYLIALSWIFFTAMFIYAVTVIAFSKIAFLRDWSGCVPGTCTKIMYRTRNILVLIAYFFTIVCFIITIILIKRARLFMQTYHKKSSVATEPNSSIHQNKVSIVSQASSSAQHKKSSAVSQSDGQLNHLPPPKRRTSLKERFPLWKLALNVCTFAFFNVFYVIWAIFIFTHREKCFFPKNFVNLMFLFGLVRISLLARIVADPVLAFVVDKQVRRNIIIMLRLHHFTYQIRPKQESSSSGHRKNSSSTAETELGHNVHDQRFRSKSVDFNV